MFRTMGYLVVSGEVPTDWDVLWTHEYSLSDARFSGAIREAKPHQTINHVPGSGYYTSKMSFFESVQVSLATSGLSKGMPMAFELPKQKERLIAYAVENPHIMWVQKDNTHRNIQVLKLEEMDLEKKSSFVQRFVDNPLLIDNRKFDIGIYTIPSLKKNFVDRKLGWRNTLDVYLQSKCLNSTIIWSQIHGIIAEKKRKGKFCRDQFFLMRTVRFLRQLQVFRNQQPKMLRSLKSIQSDGRFFELSRFDFVVDDELNVYLMEANMSPNLSSGHFRQNQVLYEQVLFNVFSLVGIASAFTKQAGRQILQSDTSKDFVVTENEIHIPLKYCTDGTCRGCDAKMLCAECMTATTKSFLRQSVLEHIDRRNMKLLNIDYSNQKVPKDPLTLRNIPISPQFQPITKEDSLFLIWREAKCKGDSTWC
ncbi:unnamed protein product [Nippostrongylus brasiliensis]|uniref:Tubulin polyglutamylase TTLL4 n=1 Tax=Nippostrongylus brasiliensis TaxID=27835 RepID=A0A0N4YNX9_NIPBR|nr:unnamed protein product [Nippostrongylus brasiliensis]